jgi:cyanate permease
MVVISYLPSYALSHGVTGPFSYQLRCIFSAATIPGRIIPGLIADHRDRFNVMIVTGAVCTIWQTLRNSRYIS